MCVSLCVSVQRAGKGVSVFVGMGVEGQLFI